MADPCTPSAPGEVQPKTQCSQESGIAEGGWQSVCVGWVPFRAPLPTLGLSLPALHSGSPAFPREGPCGLPDCPPYLLMSWDSRQRPSWQISLPGPHFPATLPSCSDHGRVGISSSLAEGPAVKKGCCER